MAYTDNPVSASLRAILWSPAILRRLGFHPRHGAAMVAENDYIDKPRRVGGKVPLTGSFMMGLKSGPKRGPLRKYKPEAVRREVKKFFHKGGTIHFQFGWWDEIDEDSVRVVVENVDLSDREFAGKFIKMAGFFTDLFKQNMIWADFYRGKRTVNQRQIEWKKQT